MIDLELLQRRGVTNKRLTAIFASNATADPDNFDAAKEGRQRITKEDIKRCQDLQKKIRSRVQEGQTRNLKDWRVYYALDVARNTPFRQVNPTLLQELVGDGTEVFKTGDDVFKKLEGMGLGASKFVEDELDEKTGKATGKKRINVPAFFQVLVPLCRAYGDIVWSKLVNARDQFPLLKFEPAYPTALQKAKCEALTNRVQVMATQYSFFEILKQACLKMVHYGTCLMFVKEEWHSEIQVVNRKATDEDVKNKVRKADGELAKSGDEVEVETVEREGLRYHLPTPTRTFRDLAHGAYTLNSDCGCMFSGFWEIVRYRELLGLGYWNTGKIQRGVKDITADYWPFFQTVYAACQIKMPTGSAGAHEAGVGTSGLDSERQLSNEFYGSDQLDQGVLITNYFEKLKPSECGLGNYTGCVWFRFVLAGDGCSILYACPMPFPPTLYAGYNPDESQDRNSSVTLEVMPFQDQFGMLLTQIILSAKQNLANLTMVNTEIMDEKEIDKMANKGERWYRFINIVGRNFKKVSKMIGVKKFENDDVFQTWTLPKANVAEMVNVLKAVLDVCDRIMQVASQEMSQQGSHEQPAKEIAMLQEAGQSRNQFIGKSVDLLIDAWKRQIYLGLMAYGDADFYAHIPADPPLTPEQLTELGFVLDENHKPNSDDKFVRVKVTKTSIIHPLYEFASTASDMNRKSDGKTAAAMAQILLPMTQNPVLLRAMGTKQILDLTNRIAHLAGIDRDFILRPMSTDMTDEDQKKQAEAQLKQVIDLVSKTVDVKLKQDLTPILQMLKESEAMISLLVHTMKIPKELVDQVLATVDKPPQPNQPQPQPAQPAPANVAPAPSNPLPGQG